MDIVERKYRFIEAFMKIINPEKLKRLEDVLNNEMENQEAIVAYTVTGEALTKTAYRDKIAQAEAEIERGEFLTHEELKQEIAKWAT